MQSTNMASELERPRQAASEDRATAPLSKRNQRAARRAGALVFGAVATGLTGCAALTPTATQEIALSTDPPGADCRLTRNQTEIARANPTPATVSIGKGAAPITISCERVGYLPAEWIAQSARRQEPTAAVYEGLFGFATVGDPNALNQYAPTIELAMTPDPSLPANLSDLQPVAPVAVERLDMPLLSAPTAEPATPR